MRRFNVTGLCTPEEDYMVDISGKIAQIKQLIDRRCYFTINRARQYGKTTTLNELQKALADEYIVISLSFQGIGDETFASSASFCRAFVQQAAQALRFAGVSPAYIAEWDAPDVVDFVGLGRHITRMCEGKKVVLLVDEVDRTSNNRVFLHFIDMLRDKFLSRKAGRDFTFHSVVLVGVYDIKNIKLKLMNEGLYAPAAVEGSIYNSPWNIAVNFAVDMSFSPAEIGTMLREYENDRRTGMDIDAIAHDLYHYTGGYPFLVSRICQCIDEELARDWTVGGIQKAIKILLDEKNTLFDDMFKNMENNKDLSVLLYDLLILRRERPFVIDDPVISIGFMYGFLARINDKIAITNKVFELRMVNYYISKDLRGEDKIGGVRPGDVVRGDRFDMELCLRKFADHYGELYNENDAAFLERHGRLLFLSYLRPLINGQGFYHIESQFTDARRMDIVVDFGRQQFIIELKLWRGEAYQADAYTQLCAYLTHKNADVGYLLTFDFRKEGGKTRKAEWVEVNGKRVFDVRV